MIDPRGRPSIPGPAHANITEAAPVQVRLVSTAELHRGDIDTGGNLVGSGDPEYLKLLDDLRNLHLLKSGGYGTDEDPMANFSAVADATGEPRYLYAIHRSIEKLTRCLSLHAQGRSGELGEEFTDTASLLLCAESMRRSDTT